MKQNAAGIAYEELPETSENDRNIWLCIPSLASEFYETYEELPVFTNPCSTPTVYTIISISRKRVINSF